MMPLINVASDIIRKSVGEPDIFGLKSIGCMRPAQLIDKRQ